MQIAAVANAGNVIETTSTRAILKSRKFLLAAGLTFH
jgi:hypothetical protein